MIVCGTYKKKPAAGTEAGTMQPTFEETNSRHWRALADMFNSGPPPPPFLSNSKAHRGPDASIPRSFPFPPNNRRRDP